MRTAISVDDELMIATLKDYLRKRQHDSIVEQLNQVYGSEPDAAEKRSAARLKNKIPADRQGTLVSGSRPAERHPYVVVQSDLFNRAASGRTVVCLITSNLSGANAPGNVLLRPGDADLSKASVVNVSQVLTIDKSELVERIGKLPAQTVDAIRSGLNLLFDRV